MLPEELGRIAVTRISLELSERKRAFANEIGRIKSGMSDQGMLFSSVTQQQVSVAIGQEYEVRALLAWQILSRVLSARPIGIDEQLAAQVKAHITEQLDLASRDLALEYETTATMMRGITAMEGLGELRERALARVGSEVDITLLSREAPSSGGAPATINIYQQFGIVQTGHGSTATFEQTFGPAQRQQLSQALTAVEAMLAHPSDLSIHQANDVREVIADVMTEVQKPSPNVARLRGALISIATTIQTLGSASAAYALLKAAAAQIGVHLP
jgi:hypothetical protein